LFQTKLDIHDRKQFELKLEYQPSGEDPKSEYLVEALLFIPRALNIDQDTWPRDAFYADLHNYVRLKTPVLSFNELLEGAHSPLVQLEQRMQLGLMGPESEVVYDAKMLACIFRRALRGFSYGIRERCSLLKHEPDGAPARQKTLEEVEHDTRRSVEATQGVLKRFRAVMAGLTEKYALSENACASLRLVDEYLSLVVEQSFRRTVVQMDAMPRTGAWADVRRGLMDVVISDESYRRQHGLASVVAPQGDNEEYTYRVSFLKKFCMNILFLKVLRSSPRKAWEEVLFAIAAGGSMAFALGVGLFAQSRYPQASFNFFIIAVMGYMLKDRIKEGLRRLLAAFAGRYLFERSTRIFDPVTHDEVGVCAEKIDYLHAHDVPADVAALRRRDDLATVAQGELAESVVRYRKKIALESEMLPRIGDGLVSGVTDIIRINVDRLLHDMDDPEYAIDYIDMEDFSIERLRAAKSYRVDLAFRFSVDDGKHRETRVRLARLVIDRNGIKRMTEFGPEQQALRTVTPEDLPAASPPHAHPLRTA
jgi:hypothetical protein